MFGLLKVTESKRNTQVPLFVHSSGAGYCTDACFVSYMYVQVYPFCACVCLYTQVCTCVHYVGIVCVSLAV